MALNTANASIGDAESRPPSEDEEEIPEQEVAPKQVCFSTQSLHKHCC